MRANVEYAEARQLTYPQFPSKFVYNCKEHIRYPRKQGFSLNILFHVPPSSSELCYARILLNKVLGVRSFDEIRNVNGIIFLTFTDAWFSIGLLDDDKEFIKGIEEISFWGSGKQVWSLFAIMLLCHTLSRPDIV